MPGVSGVGISFGADRIYDVLNALDLYPEGRTASSVRIMFTNFGPMKPPQHFLSSRNCVPQVSLRKSIPRQPR